MNRRCQLHRRTYRLDRAQSINSPHEDFGEYQPVPWLESLARLILGLMIAGLGFAIGVLIGGR